MAHFYGEIQGNRGEATRMGTKNSGFRGHIRGWSVGGSVYCHYNESEDRDECSINATRGSSGYGSEHLANVIETKEGIQISLNNNITNHCHEYDYNEIKNKIEAILKETFHADCPDLAKKIMDKLNYVLIEEPK